MIASLPHDEAVLLVADWAAGRLEGERGREVAAHVADCTECAELAETYRLLDRALAPAGQHPSSEDLVRFALGRGPSANAVEEHVATCEECRQLAQAVREAEQEPLPARRRDWRTPALIAASLLVIAGGIAMSRMYRASQPFEVANAVVVPEVHRGEPGEPVTVDARAPIVLILPRPLGVELHAPQVRIVRAGGSVVASRALSPAAGSFALVLGADALAPGDYVLQLMSADAATPVAEYAVRVTANTEP